MMEKVALISYPAELLFRDLAPTTVAEAEQDTVCDALNHFLPRG